MSAHLGLGGSVDVEGHMCSFDPVAQHRFCSGGSRLLENPGDEKIWNQAELQNDAKALDLILSEDFVMTVGDGGTLNKKETLDSVRYKSYKPTSLQSEHMQVRMHGDAAVVTGAYHEKGNDKGKPFDRRGRFTDTWMYFDNRWQCVASHFSVKPE
jgi:ketosteroid isomerase-like protein